MSRSGVAAKKASGARRGRAVPAGAPTDRIPRWLPPVAYALATVLLFREFFFAHGLLFGTDTYALSYFARNFYTEFVRARHHFPLWDPLLFGGIPFVEGMHGDIFYPLSLALFFLDARAMWGWKMVLHVFLAGVFTYVWLRGIGLRRAPAFFGGLVYMVGADLVSLVFPGGDGKLFVSALAPLMFWLTERMVRGRGVADFAFFALGIALIVFTSHMQLVYFTVWGISVYFFFRLFQVWKAERAGGTVARLLGLYTLAGVLGVAAAAVQFLPPLNYLREWSHRAGKTVEAQTESGYEYSTTWSLHPEEIASLVVPEFVGDNVPTETRAGDTYWGRNPFKLNHEFAGFVPLLLIPLLFLRRRRAETWFFLALGFFSLLYAVGATTPAFHLFYLIPGVKLFRAPSLIIFLYGLSVATLGATGLQRLLDWSAGTADEQRAVRHTLWALAAVFAVLALLASAGVITSLWQAVFEVTARQQPALQANLPYIRTGFWIAFLFAAAVAATWELLVRGFSGATAAVAALCVLAFLDGYRVDRTFIRGAVLMGRSADPVLFEPDESIRYLQQRAAAGEVFRAFDVGKLLGGATYGSPNMLAIHGIEQLTGHHGNEMGRYRTLVGGDSGANAAASELRLLNLANVAYVVSPRRIQAPGLEEVEQGSRSVVYRNTSALPRAFLAGRAVVVPDTEAVHTLLGPTFDIGGTALLPEPLPADVRIEPDPRGTVAWTARGANAATLSVNTDRPALLIITNNYYDAWHATVDGAPARLLRADYAFRAVPVPEGEHTVRLEFRNPTLRASAGVSVVLLLLLTAVAVGGTLVRRRREGRERA